MTVSYQYDAGGNRTRLTYPDNTYVSYEYDTLNRMTYVRSQSGTALAHYTYDALSRRSDLDYANGAYADYSYDTAGRVLYVDNRTNNGQHKYAYTYDYVGNRSTMIVTSGGASRTHVYSYDATYQLTHVDYPPELSYLATDTTFNYDDAGNRTSVIDGSGTTPYSTNSLNQYTAADGTSFQYDASGNMTHDATYAYGYDPENRLVKVHKSGSLPPPTLSQALDSGLTYTTGGADIWRVTSGESYQGQYSARSGYIGDQEESYLQTQVTGSGTVTFWWKVSSEPYCDYLEFWVDGVLQSGPISGNVDWEQKSYPVSGAGTHTLKWRYIKDGSVSTDNDCGWVDWVQWSGSSPPAPEPDPAAWLTLLYHYDAAGRRVEKKYDSSVVTRYVYDGDHCLAEYDVSGNLRRKYIYGPGIDQPVCMIEAAGSYAGTYYYHFDALGNVVALTSGNVDHMGETVQVYDYDVYGRVGATDPSHPNRFMFTGREFDKETGLYYYRARYYKPEIGRFLQTDPTRYCDGLNLYRYCANRPTNAVDPSGLSIESTTKKGYTVAGYAVMPDGTYIVLYNNLDGPGWDLVGIAIGLFGTHPDCLGVARAGGYPIYFQGCQSPYSSRDPGLRGGWEMMTRAEIDAVGPAAIARAPHPPEPNHTDDPRDPRGDCYERCANVHSQSLVACPYNCALEGAGFVAACLERSNIGLMSCMMACDDSDDNDDPHPAERYAESNERTYAACHLGTLLRRPWRGR